MKVRKNNPQTKGSTDLDKYDSGEDNDMEFELYNSSDFSEDTQED